MSTPDLILRNGRIATLAKDGTAPEFVEALAVRGGKVVAIGAEADLPAAGPATVVYDLDGKLAVPGLIDSHVHFVRAGRTWDDEVRWEDMYSLADALASLAARAEDVPEGRWIRVIGGWDEKQFSEKRGPTREELDAAAPNHPVYVQMQYTYVVLNSRGMTEVGLHGDGAEDRVRDSQFPQGFQRDESGALTGRAGGGPLMTWFYRQLPMPTVDEQAAGTVSLSKEFARLGMTGAIDGGGLSTGPEAYRAIAKANFDGGLKTKVRLFKHATRPGMEDEDFSGYYRFDSPGFGDDMLRFSGIGEIIMYRSHDRIADPADYSDEAMAENKAVMREAAKHGWPVQVHAHQREFMDKVMTAWEEINEEFPITDLRWGFVHGELLGAGDAERLKRLGAGALFQSLLRLNGEEAIAVWGAERVAHAPELNLMWDAGVQIGLGSDAMRVASYNPWVSLHWFLTGRTIQGNRTLADEHLLSRERALRGYTQGGAWFTFEEEERGQLVPGFAADIAVLTDDFFTIPVDEIPHLASRLTLLDGDVVHDDGTVARQS
ncbi:amidohydrolase [Microbacterium sp. ASV81]|uniref:Amidohydrolase family protein n=1 Tax=Microbacterium capsulatum TaxID=3041921 RepID=A0ABU0XHU1_9MICO|nr:amidohydrolase family protein [Microbacterium sp. ASV81]MDQ4214688.1 amidohydrolase family protein [Microbacterium sp. ASV81]